MDPRPIPTPAVDIRTIPALAWLADAMHSRWIVWRYVWNDKRSKWDKPPLQTNGRNASSSNAATWVAFDHAWDHVRRRMFDGPGLMLAGLAGEFLAAIDLDDVRDPETGALLGWATVLVASANTYCEVTPSGTGLRILGTAERVTTIQTRIQHPDGGSFELFVNCHRYITVSGQQIGTATALADISGIIEELAAIRPAPKTNGTHYAGAVALDSLPYALRDVVVRGEIAGSAPGDRSAEFFRVVRYLKARGNGPEEVSALLGSYPTGIAAKYTGRLQREVERAWGKIETPPPPDDPPPHPQGEPVATRIGRIITGDAHIGAHVPPVWLVQGIIQRSRLYACTSLTGHGKTAVWLNVACMVHAGRMMGGLKTYHGNVLYLAGENPSDLAARMLGMCRHYKIPSLKLPYVLPHAFPLTDDEATALKNEINGLGVELALIVGDTAASFFPGDDDNLNVPMGDYARLLRSLSDVPGHPAVMMLSHPIKHARDKESLLPRGGGAFLNELDGNLCLWSADKEITTLHWTGKIRGPDFTPLTFRLRPIDTGLEDEDGEAEITVIATPIDEAEAQNQAEQATANEDIVLRSLHLRPGIRPGQIAVDTGWVEDDGSPQRWKVYAAMEGLKRDKLIEQERARGPYTLTQKGKRIVDGET